MKAILSRYALVLNKQWEPIGTTTVRNAIILMSRDSAKGVDITTYRSYTWEDWTTDKDDPPEVNDYISRGANCEPIPAPEVIVLTRYDQVYRRKVRFTKKALYRRDKYICQYCRKRFQEDGLSVDHVIPSSQGGKTNFENCVTACMKCNNYKADRSLAEVGWTLPRKPERPKWNPILHVRPENRPSSWKTLVRQEWWDEEEQEVA